MRNTQGQDAMQPVDHPTWLIVQDHIDELVFHVELAPLADPEEVLASAIEQLGTHGWMIEGAPSCAGFFCNRDGERWFVHIVHYDPTRRPVVAFGARDTLRQGEKRNEHESQPPNILAREQRARASRRSSRT
jgi:hypothetical protein